MRPTVWPNKQHIVTHLQLSQFDDVKTWAGMIADSDELELFDQFCEKLHQHDQYRGVDFQIIFPEMAPYIK
jgi:hypothetical protein